MLQRPKRNWKGQRSALGLPILKLVEGAFWVLGIKVARATLWDPPCCRILEQERSLDDEWAEV